jgi:NAD(P)-dependent dehydrogenase (short-subunit alcohol dehydrogenase family)
MNITNVTGGVAVITGAASGIGAGLVSHAAGLGMRIALADVDQATIEERAEDLQQQGIDAYAIATDVSEFEQVDSLAAEVYRRWGETTLLVNNAGIELHGNTWDLPVERWQRIVDINLNGVFYGVRAFVPRMLQQATRAHVVNIASVSALRINPGTSGYAATKHGNLALTECLRAELADVTDDVIVTAVLPGAVKTRIFEDAYAAHDSGFGEETRRALAQAISESGLEPEAAAAIIFEGAARGEARVHTDPAMSQAFIQQRVQDLTFWETSTPSGLSLKGVPPTC